MERKLKMKIKSFFLLCTVVLSLTACSNVDDTPSELLSEKETELVTQSQTIVPFEGYYEYSIKEDLIGAPVNEEDYRIPQDILYRMSDEQLAQAVADYPLLANVHLYCSSPDELAFELFKISDAYKELIFRENAKEILIAKIKEIENSHSEHDEMRIQILKDILLTERIFEGRFTEEELYYLQQSVQ